ncbi:hypothetical protein V8C40DRAFT_132361 [Trichoderma camerunense]
MHMCSACTPQSRLWDKTQCNAVQRSATQYNAARERIRWLHAAVPKLCSVLYTLCTHWCTSYHMMLSLCYSTRGPTATGIRSSRSSAWPARLQCYNNLCPPPPLKAVPIPGTAFLFATAG